VGAAAVASAEPSARSAERVGLLGGTFDPPHAGHVAAALASRDVLALDRVLMVVANDPWQKTPQRRISAAGDRLAMVERAVEGLERVEASRLELDRGGASYTIETVEALRARSAEISELFVIIGSDLVTSLPTWHRVDELAQLVTLAVVRRPGAPPAAATPGWRVVDVPGVDVDVSSSSVRARVARGADLDALVPEGVVRYIDRRHLYAGDR
jgi:nicotinate-nucleotide adenylyltransferase